MPNSFLHHLHSALASSLLNICWSQAERSGELSVLIVFLIKQLWVQSPTLGATFQTQQPNLALSVSPATLTSNSNKQKKNEFSFKFSTPAAFNIWFHVCLHICVCVCDGGKCPSWNLIRTLRKPFLPRLPKELVKVKVKSLSHVRLFATPWTVAYQTPRSMGFSRQEYWNGVPFPSPGDLPDPGIKPRSPTL